MTDPNMEDYPTEEEILEQAHEAGECGGTDCPHCEKAFDRHSEAWGLDHAFGAGTAAESSGGTPKGAVGTPTMCSVCRSVHGLEIIHECE